MGLITDYFELQQKYEGIYGEKTIVLIQKGTFLEIYEYDPDDCINEKDKIDSNGKLWNNKIGHAIEMANVLNFKLINERGKKHPYNIENPHKVGVPLSSYDKNKSVILKHGFIIVRIDQQKDEKGEISRYVAEICNPSMEIDNISALKSTNNIISVYIENQSVNSETIGDSSHNQNEELLKSSKKFGYYNNTQPKVLDKIKSENHLLIIGVSIVDILTGENKICEIYSKIDDPFYSLQELYRILITHKPKELIIYIDESVDEKYITKTLELERYKRLTIKVNSVPEEYRKIAYQIEFLNKIFESKNDIRMPIVDSKIPKIKLQVLLQKNECIMDELGISELNYGRISYLLLIQFCYLHNPIIISKLSKPNIEWIDTTNHMILSHNAAIQLNIISVDKKHKKYKAVCSLMKILDQNITHLGRRLLQKLLRNPMINPNEIESYYKMVAEMLNNSLWLDIEKQLKELPLDIERLQRKLKLKLITPEELSILFQGYLKVNEIYSLYFSKSEQFDFKSKEYGFDSFVNKYIKILNLEALESCSIHLNHKLLEFIHNPINDLDVFEKYKELELAEKSLQEIVDHLNTFVKRTKLSFKDEKRDNTLIIATVSKCDTITKSKYNVKLCGKIHQTPYTTTERVLTSDKIQEICYKIDSIKLSLKKKLYELYQNILDDMNENYSFYNHLVIFVAKIDLIHSYAKVSYKYNYYKPTINGTSSYFEITELRHPIIERIISGKYVTNELSMSKILDSSIEEYNNGLLLYGVNTTGKSSLAKAVALNIIMAQIGCYTSCNLTFSPYTKIITRLSTSDSIEKGESKFEVEMIEVRTILRQSNEKTLVIGDELCSGTETDSGTALTASAILELLDKKTTFIFATHMHNLVNLPFIKESKNLRIAHLSVSFDETTKQLIFDRKLKDGSGSSQYGILVAQYLELPVSFINKAYEVLKYITNEPKVVVNSKQSKYNSKTYVDKCTICGTHEDLHTHHIQEQKLASKNKMIKHMHKNNQDNLVTLCQSCHIDIHSKNKELDILSTTTGKVIVLK